MHGRHHDGDAQRRRVGADSGRGGARADLRRERTDREGPPNGDGAAAAAAARRPGRHRPQELKPGETRKETEGVFVVRDKASASSSCRSRWASRATSILEVLVGAQGRRPGRHRPVQLRAQHRRRRSVKVDNSKQNSAQSDLRAAARQRMNKLFESASIALAAIWAPKLRSFMTVLGNIVAVTSIIAVVSLIQGLNASVKQAILNAGRRRLVQHPAVPGHAQRRGLRQGPQQPAHHAARRARDPALRREQSPAVMADIGGAAAHHAIATSRSDNTRSQGVTAELHQLLRASTPSAGA